MKINNHKATQLVTFIALMSVWITLYLEIINSWYFIPTLIITCGLGFLLIAMTTRHLLDPDHKDEDAGRYNQHTDYDGE